MVPTTRRRPSIVLTDALPGLDQQMLEDLLTPDDEPEGNLIRRWDDSPRLLIQRGRIAGQTRKLERGTRAGASASFGFQPVELLAGERLADHLLASAPNFPRREQDRGRSARRLRRSPPGGGRALGAREPGKRRRPRGRRSCTSWRLATRRHIVRSYTWLEDWELSLYVEDDLDNRDRAAGALGI